MSTKIKLCGLKRQQDIEAVNRVRPDYAGFIIEVSKSSRNVTREQVSMLTAGLDPAITPVGVFVNAPAELPAKLLEAGVIAIAQLHGQEDEAYIRQLRSLTPRPIIKAFSIRTAEDMERALLSSADYLLLDQGGGGTGRTFDWSLVPRIDRPFFLAGGLGEDNLEQAIRRVKPWAVDLSSSLETGGFKDEQKMRRAVELVRGLG